ncbi:MAG: hypothetical protein EOO70_00130 [Myxococcaceae bacterium]|nr:MAG: hypothetical protein EOO70_00130 [Myxococcaceae bacterium]
MTATAPTRTQDVELSLIQQDLSDLARVLFAPKGTSSAGPLIFLTAPLLGLVVEESTKYLSSPSLASVLTTPAPYLSQYHAHRITKTRARIKMFDDNKGYSAGLVQLLLHAKTKSHEWFNAPHKGILRSLVKNWQPDIGAYFVGDHLVATTHIALPALGMSSEEISALTPDQFLNLGESLALFAENIGVYIKNLADVLGSLERSVQLKPDPIREGMISITHNDFIGSNFYRLAQEAFPTTQEKFLGPITMAMSHINTTLYVLPKLVSTSSNLLFRARFMTAYYAERMLREAAPSMLAGAFPFSETDHVLKGARNICAHYGLHSAAPAAINSSEPFGAAIQAVCPYSRDELAERSERWLQHVSSAMSSRFSKSSLAHVRAFWGDHT